MKESNVILMIGPDPERFGGISRVVKIWLENNFLNNYDVKYISTVSGKGIGKVLRLLHAIGKLLRTINSKCRFIYIHTSSSNGFYRKSIFIIIGILFRKKIILHLHPTHFCDFFSNTIGLRKKYIVSVLKHIDAFVVLSEESRNFFSAYYPDTPIYVVENPINISEMSNRSGVAREECNLLYLGCLIRPKGVYDLVDAIELVVLHYPEIHLDFYGDREVDELRRYVEDKKLSKNISVNGWIMFEEKIEALYRHTLLILPSYSEGIPNVILEAMATKLPIISTAVGGLREILIDGENCVVTDAGSPEDLSEKILMCLRDEHLRERISHSAYLEVERKYDVKTIKPKVCEVLDAMSRSGA